MMFEIKYKYYTKLFTTSLTYINFTGQNIHEDCIHGYILFICSYVCCVCIAAASSRTFKIPGSWSLEMQENSGFKQI